jgi:hypothetical protein
MQRCVKIATKSVHYFRRFEVMNELAVIFIYIYIYIYKLHLNMRVIECNVVSKLQRNRCITFGDWRS